MKTKTVERLMNEIPEHIKQQVSEYAETQPARTSQTFYRKRIYKISPTPGQINGDTVEINAYPIGAMAVAA
jgi:urease accessory protein UreH